MQERPVPEIIDPVFAKTSPIRSFLVIKYERFGLVFAKTGYINSGTGFAMYSRKHHKTSSRILPSFSASCC
jgi:hypothetical protein